MVAILALSHACGARAMARIDLKFKKTMKISELKTICLFLFFYFLSSLTGGEIRGVRVDGDLTRRGARCCCSAAHACRGKGCRASVLLECGEKKKEILSSNLQNQIFKTSNKNATQFKITRKADIYSRTYSLRMHRGLAAHQ